MNQTRIRYASEFLHPAAPKQSPPAASGLNQKKKITCASVCLELVAW